jgi:hypothetical protein
MQIKTKSKQRVRQRGLTQGMLIAGSGPVARIETSLACFCSNMASNISAIRKT